MTCDEYRQIYSTTQPREVSRATRWAMIDHNDKCGACRKWGDEEDQKAPPSTDEEELSALVLMLDDMQDPEIREQIRRQENEAAK